MMRITSRPVALTLALVLAALGPFMPLAPGMGMNRVPSCSMPGRSGYGSGGMGSGSGYSAGGSGSPSGASMTSPGLSGGYVNLYDPSAFAQGQAQNASGGPLLGLLNAEGGLAWPLALRILPPEIEVRGARYSEAAQRMINR
jgi:hypothetical protein